MKEELTMSFISEVQQQGEALYRAISRYYEKDQSEGEKIRAFLKGKNINKIIFTGMGSSLFASYIPCTYLQKKYIDAHAYESCELTEFFSGMVNETTLIIAVSQSGESRETINAASFFNKSNNIITVTNDTQSKLTEYGILNLPILAETEKTSANKTYTNTIAVLMYLAYIISDVPLNEIETAKDYLKQMASFMHNNINPLTDEVSKITAKMLSLKYIAVIGSGHSYSTACQGELLLIEAIKQYASGFTVNQFMHGPLEIIDEDFGAIILDFQENMRGETDSAISLIKRFGGKALVISNRKIIESDQIYTVRIDCREHILSPVIEMFPIELYLYEMGKNKNITPGILSRTGK